MAKRWALFSVWDKAGIVDLAGVLITAGYSLLSTARTAAVLRDAGLAVTEVSDWTGAPEILGGRVKTIHPKVAAGILSLRDEQEIEPIDVVVCNLYPFQEGLRGGLELKAMMELIDIGGVTLLRAAAKNWFFVLSVPEPVYYQRVMDEFRRYGRASGALRRELAQRTFELTGSYDRLIAEYFKAIIDRYPDLNV